jgi:hypothetical protein
MNTAMLRNLLIYAGVAVVNALAIALAAALAAGSLPGFREGEFLAPATASIIALMAILTPILTAWLASNRPRFGSEGLADDANQLRAMGISRADMEVVEKPHQQG